MRLSPDPRRRRARAASIAVLGVLTGMLAVLAPVVPVVSAPAAAGASSYLCWGYSGCAQKGYSHAGYASRSNKMYWRMYSGHNCTNYVAYRMIQAGMSTARPWSGSGNAYNWGLAMRNITDQRPAVGAVAWWNRNVPGAGSVGHVAYVERVVSPSVIIVSQDSWGGEFSWKRIEKNHSGWPSGFIHFRDKSTLVNVARPVLPITARVGAPIRLRVGTWKPGGNDYTYQWMADGRAIAKATSFRFTPLASHRGKRLTVRVRAARPGHTPVSAVSNATTPVAAGVFTNSVVPTVVGEPMVGETLRATPGTYAPRVTAAYTWFADGVAIRAATKPTLALTRALVGKTITVRETATAAGYTTKRVNSAPVGPVLQGSIEEARPVTGSGTPLYGETLTVDPGTSVPAATATVRWLRDGVPIPGAVTASYRLVSEDLGHRITARVHRTRPNYEPLTTDHAFDQTVRTSSRLRVGTTGYSRVAAVRVRIGAPGTVPDGRVRVQVRATTAVARLVDGFARVIIRDLPPGRRLVKVWYGGTNLIVGSTYRGWVHVKR